MDTHTESVSEAPAVEAALEQIPDAYEANSFEAALNAAFQNLESGGDKPQETADVENQQTNDVAEETPVSETTEQEVDPIEQLTEEVDWTPKSANRFKQLKEELKGSRSELEQLRQISKEQEAKLQEMSALVENKDVEQLQSKLAQYEQERMFTNLEQTTAYQETITKPLSFLMNQADQIADKYEIDANALIDVLALDDSEAQDERLSELLPHASDRDKARIYRIIEEIDPILERRKLLYDNVDAAAQEAAYLTEVKQKQELAERAQVRNNITRNVVERITEKLPFVKTLDGIDLQTLHTKAASVDPTVIHPVDFAYNAVSAQLLPTIVREYVGLRKEIESLTDKLAEYETAEPTLSSGSPAKAQKYSSSGSDGGFVDAINRAFGSM
jgi:hypothetical protein